MNSQPKIEKLQNGDTSLAKINPEKWVENHEKFLYKYAIPRVKDDTIARDLIQDTFEGALIGINRYKGDATERTWLVGILKNKIYDFYKKKEFEKTKLVSRSYEEAEASSEDLLVDEYYLLNLFQEEAIAESQKRVELILASLPKGLSSSEYELLKRMAFLKQEKGDICKEMNITDRNYRVILSRARKATRKVIRDFAA